jgi:hypothetical protein
VSGWLKWTCSSLLEFAFRSAVDVFLVIVVVTTYSWASLFSLFSLLMGLELGLE